MAYTTEGAIAASRQGPTAYSQYIAANPRTTSPTVSTPVVSTPAPTYDYELEVAGTPGIGTRVYPTPVVSSPIQPISQTPTPTPSLVPKTSGIGATGLISPVKEEEREVPKKIEEEKKDVSPVLTQAQKEEIAKAFGAKATPEEKKVPISPTIKPPSITQPPTLTQEQKEKIATAFGAKATPEEVKVVIPPKPELREPPSIVEPSIPGRMTPEELRQMAMAQAEIAEVAPQLAEAQREAKEVFGEEWREVPIQVELEKKTYDIGKIPSIEEIAGPPDITGPSVSTILGVPLPTVKPETIVAPSGREFTVGAPYTPETIEAVKYEPPETISVPTIKELTGIAPSLSAPIGLGQTATPSGLHETGKTIYIEGQGNVFLPEGYVYEGGPWVITPYGAKVELNAIADLIKHERTGMSTAPPSPFTGGWGPEGAWYKPTGRSQFPASVFTSGKYDELRDYLGAESSIPSSERAEIIRSALAEERKMESPGFRPVPEKTEVVETEEGGLAIVPASDTTWRAIPVFEERPPQKASEKIEYEWDGNKYSLDVTGLNEEERETFLFDHIIKSGHQREVEFSSPEEMSNLLGIPLDDAKNWYSERTLQIIKEAGDVYDSFVSGLSSDEYPTISRSDFIRSQLDEWGGKSSTITGPTGYKLIETPETDWQVQSPGTGEWVDKEYLESLSSLAPASSYDLFAEYGIEKVKEQARDISGVVAQDSIRLSELLSELTEKGIGRIDSETGLGQFKPGDINKAYSEGLISYNDVSKLFGEDVAKAAEEWSNFETKKDEDYIEARSEDYDAGFAEKMGARTVEFFSGRGAHTKAYDYEEMLDNYEQQVMLFDAVNKGRKDVIVEAYELGLFDNSYDKTGEKIPPEQVMNQYLEAIDSGVQADPPKFKEFEEDYFKGGGVWDTMKYLVPIYGTALTIKERGLKSGWSWLSIGGDVLFFFPLIGAGARGAATTGQLAKIGKTGILTKVPTVLRPAYSAYALGKDVITSPITLAKGVVKGEIPIGATIKEGFFTSVHPITHPVQTWIQSPYRYLTGRQIYAPQFSPFTAGFREAVGKYQAAKADIKTRAPASPEMDVAEYEQAMMREILSKEGLDLTGVSVGTERAPKVSEVRFGRGGKIGVGRDEPWVQVGAAEGEPRELLYSPSTRLRWEISETGEPYVVSGEGTPEWQVTPYQRPSTPEIAPEMITMRGTVQEPLSAEEAAQAAALGRPITRTRSGWVDVPVEEVPTTTAELELTPSTYREYMFETGVPTGRPTRLTIGGVSEELTVPSKPITEIPFRGKVSLVKEFGTDILEPPAIIRSVSSPDIPGFTVYSPTTKDMFSSLFSQMPTRIATAPAVFSTYAPSISASSAAKLFAVGAPAFLTASPIISGYGDLDQQTLMYSDSLIEPSVSPLTESKTFEPPKMTEASVDLLDTEIYDLSPKDLLTETYSPEGFTVEPESTFDALTETYSELPDYDDEDFVSDVGFDTDLDVDIESPWDLPTEVPWEIPIQNPWELPYTDPFQDPFKIQDPEGTKIPPKIPTGGDVPDIPPWLFPMMGMPGYNPLVGGGGWGRSGRLGAGSVESLFGRQTVIYLPGIAVGDVFGSPLLSKEEIARTRATKYRTSVSGKKTNVSKGIKKIGGKK